MSYFKSERLLKLQGEETLQREEPFFVQLLLIATRHL